MTKNTTTFQISANDSASNVFKKFADVVKHSGNKTKDFGSGLSSIQSQFARGRVGADAFVKSIGGLDNSSKVIDKLKNKFKELDKVIIGIGISAGALAGIKSALNAFSTQEDAMAELRASMIKSDGTIDSSISKIEELSKSLGEKYPGSAADAINTMKALVQQGIDVDKILGKQEKGYGGLGEAATKLGAFLKIPGEEAATSLSKISDATKTGVDDMNELADTFARMKNSGVTLEDTSNSLSNISTAMGLIKKSGIEGVNAIAPVLVLLDNASMKGETASIAFNKLLNAGLDLKKVGDINKLLGKDKVSFIDEKGNFAGIENFFKQLDKIKSLQNDVAKTKALKTIFGEDAQTLQALNALMDKGFNGYQEILNKMKGQGSLDQKLKETSSTITSTTDRMAGSFENMKATIGKAFEGDFKIIADVLGDVSDKVGQLAEKFPALTKLIGYTTLGIGLATLAMGAFSLASKTGLITTGITVFSSAFGFLRSSILAATIAIRLMGIAGLSSLGAILSPIGLVIGALGVLAYIFRNEIMALGGGFWAGITESLKPLGNTLSVIGGLIGGLIDRFLSLFGATNQSKAGLEAWGATGKTMGEAVGTVFKVFLTTITGLIDGVHLLGVAFDAVRGKQVNIDSIGSATRALWAGTIDGSKPAANPAINPNNSVKQLSNGVMLPANPKALISTSKANVTGKLDININSQGKAQVAQMKSSSGFTLNAKTGNMVNAV